MATAMAAYNAISARRVQRMAGKLLDYANMKKIETNIRGSNYLTTEVFTLLGKCKQ